MWLWRELLLRHSAVSQRFTDDPHSSLAQMAVYVRVRSLNDETVRGLAGVAEGMRRALAHRLTLQKAMATVEELAAAAGVKLQ